jgi:rhodanese-related sulfurtransferase
MYSLITFFFKHWGLSIAFLITLIVLVLYEKTMRAGASTISSTEAIDLINHQNGVIIDIRNSILFQQGHIIHAISIQPKELDTTWAQLKPYQNKPIIIVDDLGGALANDFARKLLKQDFQSVQILAGGMKSWQTDNLPIEKA